MRRLELAHDMSAPNGWAEACISWTQVSFTLVRSVHPRSHQDRSWVLAPPLPLHRDKIK